jgi:hypothetical protein
MDGDFTNNDSSNLECLSPREHAHRHHPMNLTPRHLRPGRREYMTVYLQAYYRRKKEGMA